MDPDFGGDVAGFYQRYRRGYPPAVIDKLAGKFGLTTDDIAIDVGCGTGQLTCPSPGGCVPWPVWTPNRTC